MSIRALIDYEDWNGIRGLRVIDDARLNDDRVLDARTEIEIELGGVVLDQWEEHSLDEGME